MFSVVFHYNQGCIQDEVFFSFFIYKDYDRQSRIISCSFRASRVGILDIDVNSVLPGLSSPLASGLPRSSSTGPSAGLDTNPILSPTLDLPRLEVNAGPTRRNTSAGVSAFDWNRYTLGGDAANKRRNTSAGVGMFNVESSGEENSEDEERTVQDPLLARNSGEHLLDTPLALCVD